ncbi:Smr/MutS family protein [Chondromyces apiculatus]|nr:Smr/MutS family protein [Chondromyces apiculatus]
MRKRTKSQAAKAVKAADTPFFQPFAGLKRAVQKQRQEKKKEDARAAAAQAASRSAHTPAHPTPGSSVATGSSGTAPLPRPRALDADADEPPKMVDPDTFAIYMAGVRVLDHRGVERIPTTASRVERATPGSVPVQDLDAEARDRMRSLVIEGIRFEISDDGEHLEGRRLDVDPRALRLLRRGRFAIDGTLDLHGHRADEARTAVEGFIRRRQGEGDRVVALIHGKGNHSPGGRGVLRGEIAAWLSQGAAARHVAAFATAPTDDGGNGTLLVLLAR